MTDFILTGPNDPVERVCNLDSLLVTRLLIQANSGGGKSFALRRILEQTHGRLQHLVIDPEGEFATLRERFDYVWCAKTGGDATVNPKTAGMLAERLLDLRVSAILDIYDLAVDERISFVRHFVSGLVNAPRHLWHPTIVAIDEAHVFCPQRGDDDESSRQAVMDLCTRGRKRGFCPILATQRISKLHKDAAAELNNKLIGRTALDVDIKRAAEELGFSNRAQRNQLRHLKPGDFFMYGPSLSAADVVQMHIGPVVTTHPQLGGRVAFDAPPPSDTVKSLLPQLQDLPEDGADDDDGVVGMPDTVRAQLAEYERIVTDLRGQLDAARSGLAPVTAPPVELPPPGELRTLSCIELRGVDGATRDQVREHTGYTPETQAAYFQRLRRKVLITAGGWGRFYLTSQGHAVLAAFGQSLPRGATLVPTGATHDAAQTS